MQEQNELYREKIFWYHDNKESKKKYSRILLTGVPGSGRHFLLSKIEKIIEPKNLLCSSYSTLLLEELKKIINNRISLDDLRNIEYRVMSNAKSSLNKMLSKTDSWILSSLMCYKQERNYLFSVDTIRELGPDIIIHISSGPDEILLRRKKNREKFYDDTETEKEIAFHQHVSESISKATADLIGCDYLIMSNLDNNTEISMQILQKIIGSSYEL